MTETRCRIRRGPFEDNLGEVVAVNPDDSDRLLVQLVRFGDTVTVEVARVDVEMFGDGQAGVREPIVAPRRPGGGGVQRLRPPS